MNTEPQKRRPALAILLVPLVSMVVFLALIAFYARGLSDRGSTESSIRLSEVSLQREVGQLYLTARADIELPDPIRDGLDSGVPLDFILTLKFRQSRPYWFDHSLAQYQQRFRLSYYELTRHYRVHAVDTGISRNYRSLYAALEGLGSIHRLPVALDPATASHINTMQVLSRPSSQVEAELEFGLDSKSLPLPLQPLIASSWRLNSEGFQWQFN